MNIIYKEDHILVIDKPAGIPVLPDGWEQDAPYLVKMLEEEYGRLWVVHRLDKGTSGVMIFARDAEAHRSLNTQFENHEAMKTYHAIVEGNPKWEEKVVKFPLRANVGHKHAIPWNFLGGNLPGPGRSTPGNQGSHYQRTDGLTSKLHTNAIETPCHQGVSML